MSEFLPQAELARNIELAGALQAVMHDVTSRPYILDVQQEESLFGIGSALVAGDTTGYVEMATGTGKTTVEALLTEAAVNAGMRVLLLAPSVTAATQVSGIATETPKGIAKFTDLHERNNHQVVRSHFGKKQGNRTAPVVVSTYQGFLADYKKNHENLGQFDVVIADECHKSLGRVTSQALLDAFPGAIKIGLSATPDYAVDRQSDEVYNKRLYEFSLSEAIELGKTAPIRALVMETDTTLRLTDNRQDFTDREQSPLVTDVQRNGLICNLATDFVRDGRQGIIACVAGEGNLHARQLAAMLSRPEFGALKAAAIGAHLSEDEVRDTLKKFANGEIDVLTSTRAILESWDSDRASFCINTSPTTSPVKVKQLLGRILRPKEDDRAGIFVDLLDNQTGLRKEQYTALHALDLQEVDYDRVLGQYKLPNKQYEMNVTDLPEFSEELLKRLQRVQGKTLADVFKPKLAETEDPLVKHWEKILAAEGMPSNLGTNVVLPKRFSEVYDKAVAQFVHEMGTLPTNEEIIDKIVDKLPRYATYAIKAYGIQLAIDSVDSLDLPEYMVSDFHGRLAAQYVLSQICELEDLDFDEAEFADSSFDQVNDSLLIEQLDAVLDTLSEREAGVVAMFHGIRGPQSNDPKRAYVTNYQLQERLTSIDPDSRDEVGYITGDEYYTLDNIGKVYGITRERVRQIWSKTMSKIRHQSRSDVLRDYIFEPSRATTDGTTHTSIETGLKLEKSIGTYIKRVLPVNMWPREISDTTYYKKVASTWYRGEHYERDWQGDDLLTSHHQLLNIPTTHKGTSYPIGISEAHQLAGERRMTLTKQLQRAASSKQQIETNYKDPDHRRSSLEMINERIDMLSRSLLVAQNLEAYYTTRLSGVHFGY